MNLQLILVVVGVVVSQKIKNNFNVSSLENNDIQHDPNKTSTLRSSIGDDNKKNQESDDDEKRILERIFQKRSSLSQSSSTKNDV
jgi:hypothetical protein